MTLRKLAASLAVTGLIVGLLGSGVGASFFMNLTGTENIAVGDFSCRIINPSDGSIAADLKSVTYDVPKITSSAPGSAPFSFTVQNNGAINQVLTVSMTLQTGNLGGKFSAMPATPSPVLLAAGATQLISTGIQWDELDNDDLGRAGSMTWTVNCGEPAPSTPLIHYTFKSTNTWNIAGTVPGHGTTIGPNVTAVDNHDGTITLNFIAGTLPGHFVDCFEYVTNGNVPQQKLGENGGVNYNNTAAEGDPIVLDGLFPYTCLHTPGIAPQNTVPETDTITLPVGHGGYVEVRMVFGAESDFRFDWTMFNAV